MQTFLASTNTLNAARALDNKRLNKQILECYQILNVLSGRSKTGAWRNHPAVLMWRYRENSLHIYLKAIMEECLFRGISTEKNWNAITEMHESNWDRGGNVLMPEWWGDERIHKSHRNNLYKKDPEWYHMFVNDSRVSCCEKCNYFWPTHTIYHNQEVENLVEV
jgi:hypothetical protein